jgi:hypothetical protein
MRENETKEQTNLIEAICLIMKTACPERPDNIGSFATLIVYGPTHTPHGMAMTTFQKEDHPLHGLAYELWKLRSKLNPYWKDRGATAG